MELTQSFASNGWTVKYHIFGADHPQTIVFVHGTPWSSAVFVPLAKALLSTKKYRIILYDLAGYGQSQGFNSDHVAPSPRDTRFRGDTSVRTQALILSDLFKHLHLNSQDNGKLPAVVAHDIAGAIALRAHLMHGCDYQDLLLLDTNAVLPWGDGFYKLARSEAGTFLQLPLPTFEAMVRAVVRSASHSPETFSRIWEDTLASPWISDEEQQRSFVRQIAQANDEDVREMLDQDMYANVRCPVKIMWGESDSWIPKEKLKRLAELLGGRCEEFVGVEDAGHLIMLDQPERVAVEVMDWLSKR